MSRPPGSVASAPPDPVARIQELMDQVEALSDPSVRALVDDLLQSILRLHGSGLERLMQILARPGAGHAAVTDAVLRDEVLRGLLLIHGLHPADLETRLREALAKVLPYIHSHGGDVELVSLVDGVARLRLHGTCKGCASSAVTLELAVRAAIEEFCPDLAGFEVDDVSPPELPANGPGQRWIELPAAAKLDEGEVRPVNAGDLALVVCRAEGKLFAYRNRCPRCAENLAAAALHGAILRCPQGHAFDVQRAGAAPDDATVHLEPFPLLAEDGRVQVAVPGEMNTS